MLAALLLVTAGSVVGAVTAVARGSLPYRGAAQLLVDAQTAQLKGLSGRISETADLGLPAIPGTGGDGSSSSLSGLVSGTHELQLWYADPQHVRLAVLGQLGESDVIRNGSDLWMWSSSDRTVTHRTVPTGNSSQDGTLMDGTLTDGTLADGTALTPQQLATQALKAITPSTKVTTDGTAVVAGRSAYELVLQPRDTRSLVESVRIAIDSATHVPTRVQVYARGSGSPALEVGFTSFDPTTPPASTFDFTPPPGAKVTQSTTSGTSDHGVWQHSSSTPGDAAHGDTTDGGGTPAPHVVGSGWTSVLVSQVPALTSGSSPAQALLQKLPEVRGSWGSGRLLQGTLFSAILTDNGTVAVGAVAPALLEQALSAR